MERWGDGGDDGWVSEHRGDTLLLLGYGVDGAMELMEHVSKRSMISC